jgi:hypothetical protein
MNRKIMTENEHQVRFILQNALCKYITLQLNYPAIRNIVNDILNQLRDDENIYFFNEWLKEEYRKEG